MLKYVLWGIILASIGLSIATTVYWAMFYNLRDSMDRKETLDEKAKVAIFNGYIQYWGMVINAISAVALLTLLKVKTKFAMPVLGLLTAGLLYDSISSRNAFNSDTMNTIKTVKNFACGEKYGEKICKLVDLEEKAINVGNWASPVAIVACAAMVLKLRS